MVSVHEDVSLTQFQDFVKAVYSMPNDRNFSIEEMLNNIQRFAMRGLKGIRKRQTDKIKKNLIISFSWLLSTLNRLHVNLEEQVWKRFPYLCSYCGSNSCICKENKIEERVRFTVEASNKPGTLAGYQRMFNNIYPPSSRTLEHAGVHLAEEVGEFSEALMAYRAEKRSEDFNEVLLEAADYFSCLIGVFNSLNIDLAKELAYSFPKNCHECLNAPCTCTYTKIKIYSS